MRKMYTGFISFSYDTNRASIPEVNTNVGDILEENEYGFMVRWPGSIMKKEPFINFVDKKDHRGHYFLSEQELRAYLQMELDKKVTEYRTLLEKYIAAAMEHKRLL